MNGAPAFEDTSIFFDTDEFAVPCSYEGNDFPGILDAPNSLLGTIAEIEISANLHTVLLQEQHAAVVQYDKTITVNGVDYRAGTKQPTGDGMTVIPLDEI